MFQRCQHESELVPTKGIVDAGLTSYICRDCGSLLDDPAHPTWARELSLHMFYESQN